MKKPWCRQRTDSNTKALKGVAALISLILFSGRAYPNPVPDPCNLVSPTEIQQTLGLAHEVVIKPGAEPAPQVSWQWESGGAGTIWLDSRDTPRKDDFICSGRAGDLFLFVRVRPAKDAEAERDAIRKRNEAVEKKWGHSFEQKWGAKVESSVQGRVTCNKGLFPSSDLLGRERNMAEPMVVSMSCYEDHGEQQLSIGVTPWAPKRFPPAMLENLRVLVSKAVSRL